jgi:hypothetical protein
MARPKGSHDIAPMIRGAFLRAAKSLELKGKPLSTLIERELEERPIETLKALASFNPTQKSIDVTHNIDITETIRLVTERQKARLEKDITPKPEQLEKDSNRQD